ncbi:MAG: hypothetical protein CMO01_00485 [Thalassobius sp.]|nr:hypothetical protein [Thalassovita sp.]
MKHKNIVVLAHPDWINGYETNTKKIVHEFTKQNRVLYVQAPINRFNSIFQKNNPAIKNRLSVLNKEIDPLIKLKDNLWMLYPTYKEEALNLAINNWTFNFINRINSRRFAEEILKATKELGFDDFVIFNDRNPILGLHLKELLKPEKYIYYISQCEFTDQFQSQVLTRHEPKMLRKADIVVTNSLYYKEYASSINENTYFIGQGNDINIDDTIESNSFDLRNTFNNNLPIIGCIADYSTSNLDLKLFEEILIERPKWNLVLMHSLAELPTAVQQLEKYGNFSIVPLESTKQKNAYLQQLDVCIIPEIANTFAKEKYPEKLDEYLALGKATVSTKTIANDIFSEHVYMASSSEEFIVKIEHALAEDNHRLMEERKEFASLHNWQNTVQEIYNSIEGKSNIENMVA